MNYERIYFEFVNHWKNQEILDGEYYETHHIIPQYCGGSNDFENLVRVTYPQHVFLHKLWWKITGDIQAEVAYKLMSGISKEFRLEISRMGGLINVESGHLDNIRHLANTPERQRKLKLLNEEKKTSGWYNQHMPYMNSMWRGKSHTEEFKVNRSIQYKEKFKENSEYRKNVLKAQRISADNKIRDGENHSKSIIENAERNVEFLTKISKRSKNIFVSPEGLFFESPIYAASYYGNVESYIIENWCKRNKYGWRRVPKQGGSNELT